jgi:hypothetical protein
MFILDTITVTFVFASILFFTAKLFRFSLRHYWLQLAAAALLSSVFNIVTGIIVSWDSFRPLFTLLLQAAMLHVFLKISKWHSLLLSFLGLITYTLLLGLALFLNHTMTGSSYHEIFFDVENEYLNQLFAGCMMILITAFLSRYRLGFSLVSDPKGAQKGWKHEKIFTVVFLLSIIVFSVAHYAITIRIHYLLWAAIGFLISLTVLVLYLYYQEMDDD